MVQKIPLKRVGDPDDIAQMSVYFASDESRHVSGAELVVNGGNMFA